MDERKIPKSDIQSEKLEGLYPKYFVGKPRGDNPYAAASRKALRVYAEAILSVNPVLARELREWADNEMIATESAQKTGEALVRRHQREQR